MNFSFLILELEQKEKCLKYPRKDSFLDLDNYRKNPHMLGFGKFVLSHFGLQIPDLILFVQSLYLLKSLKKDCKGQKWLIKNANNVFTGHVANFNPTL